MLGCQAGEREGKTGTLVQYVATSVETLNIVPFETLSSTVRDHRHRAGLVNQKSLCHIMSYRD